MNAPFNTNHNFWKGKVNTKEIILRGKISKLHKTNIKSDFSSYLKEFKVSSEADMSIKCYWKVLEGALDMTFEWTKSPARQRETKRLKDDVSKSVSEKCKFWKE